MIHVPFIIVSVMEDPCFPDEIDSNSIQLIKNHPYFRHFFAVNKTFPNDHCFTSLPYGLDYHTLQNRSLWQEPCASSLQQDEILQEIAKDALHFSERIPMIYANFHLHKTDEIRDIHGSGDRSRLSSIIPRDIIYFENERVRRSESWRRTSEYAFVLSPFGNGIDCIRTFEALCLGCIVIILKNKCLDHLYHDLPVVRVDQWSDVTQELLQDALFEFSTNQFDYTKLTMSHFVDLCQKYIL